MRGRDWSYKLELCAVLVDMDEISWEGYETSQCKDQAQALRISDMWSRRALKGVKEMAKQKRPEKWEENQESVGL